PGQAPRADVPTCDAGAPSIPRSRTLVHGGRHESFPRKPAAAPLPPPAARGQHYGFLGPEVSRFNDGLSRLQTGDLDGDGVADLAVINNGRARIELLLRRRAGEPAGDGTVPEADKVNDLADESFFHRESVPVEEKVGSLSLCDMDGDGRCELLFTGDSGRATIAWTGARGGTARSVRLRLPAEGATR